MALNKTLRPGLIQMRVLDLDQTLDFYTNILGLNEVGRTEDGRVMLKGYDEFDHHSVTLRLADEAGLDYVAFKVDSPETLESLKARGMRAQRFDHCLLYGPNIAEAEKYFTEILGMFAPEVCNTPEGNRFATWLTSGNKAHDIAFVEYEKPGKIHHLAFLLQDWNDIGNAADFIGRYSLKRDVGPTRHAITRGQTIYFWEPSGNRIETYCGGYTAYPDNPVRVWDVSEVGKGLFYYEGELIPSFLQVVT